MAAVARVVIHPLHRRDVVAVGNLGDLRAEQLLAVVHPGVRGGHHDIGPVTGQQRCEATRAQPGRGVQGLDVAAIDLGGPDVVEDVADQLLVELAAALDLQRPVVATLGEIVEGIGAQPRRGRAQVGQVCRVGRPGQQPAVVKDRDGDADVGQMRGAVARVVVQEDVVGRDVLAPHLTDAAQVGPDRAAVHRGRFALGDLLTVGGVQPGPQILGLADDLEEGGAEDHLRHLLGDRAERAAEDAHRHRIQSGLGVAHGSTSRRLPWSSTSPRTPGAITVVESNCSITAGPCSTSPARNAARS